MSTAVCAATPVSAARRVPRGMFARSHRAPVAFVAHRERPRRRSQGRWECFARGGRADEQPFDPDGLSPAERAAMRNEWSLECRQVGLDAEAFGRAVARLGFDPEKSDAFAKLWDVCGEGDAFSSA